MRTRTLFITMFIAFFSIGSINGQVEEETGFKYVKGNYLFDSGRFDEAIQIYNDILKGDPAYEDALIYRARAKYALGAYKGAKKDGLAYIQYNGLNEDVCLIMGKAELGLGNPLVAISYLDYVLMVNRQNIDGLLFRGDAYFEIEDDVQACTDWHKAIKLGSGRAEQQANSYCQRVAIPIDDEPATSEDEEDYSHTDDGNDDTLDDGEVLSSGNVDDDELDEDEVLSSGTSDESNDSSSSEGTNADDTKEESPMRPEEVIMIGEDGPISNNGEVISSGTQTTSDDEPKEEVIPVDPVDDTVEVLDIDDDLDIKIYGGVGNRRVRNVPDILVLADKEGQVVVDICIDRSGNVKSASLNRNESTIGSAGLISLSLRKAREFKFDRSRKSEQCGKIAFVIKG